MDGVSLKDALERIDISGIRERAEGIADLKHVLRHHQRTARTEQLSDVSLHHIFEILFRAVINDQSAYVKAKPGNLKTAAANRLSSYAGALRLAVEVGVASVRLKTVRALVDHILQTLFLANGDLCEPLATDYAKCLRTVLSYQPHVEHLPPAEWERIAIFCAERIASAQSETSTEDTSSSATPGTQHATPSHVSYRSSHSRARAAASSQGVHGLLKQIAEEMVVMLRMLTAAPNAPLAGKLRNDKTPQLVWTLIGYLKSGTPSTRAQQDAFATCNNFLAWAQSENIALVKQVTVHLLRLVRVYWNTKSTSLKDEMLITLQHLKLYIRHLVQQDGAAALRAEICSLYGVMIAEYSQRKDREVLHMDDLRLCLQPKVELVHESGSLNNSLMSLRCVGARAEHSWLLVSILAFFVETVREDHADVGSSSEDDANNGMQRPRKKQRIASEFEELVALSRHGSQQQRTAALQVLTFLAQQKVFSTEGLVKALDAIHLSCNEENTSIASWALLAAASFALQVSATDPSLAPRWDSLWQQASRSLSSVTYCRAASHLVRCMISLNLVGQESVAEHVQSLAMAIELSGPALMCDSALQLLRTAIQVAPFLAPAAMNAVADSIFGWVLRRWTTSKFDDRGYAALHNLHQPSDILGIISDYLGQPQIPLHSSAGFRTWESPATAYIRMQSDTNLVSYLLSLPDSPNVISPFLAKGLSSESTSVPSRVASRFTSEALLLTHLQTEISRAYTTWSSLVKERPRGISGDVFATICTSAAVSTSIAYSSWFADKRRLSHVQSECRQLLDSICKYVESEACDQYKVDVMLMSLAGIVGVSNRGTVDLEELLRPNACQVLLCRFIDDSISNRSSQHGTAGDIDDNDMMDTGPSHESQDSRSGGSVASGVELTDKCTVTYSSAALRASLPLYASLLVTTVSHGHESSGPGSVSSTIIDDLVRLDETSIIAGRSVLTSLPSLISGLTAADTERLLEHFTEKILNVYAFERSEVAIGTIIDIMVSLVAFWTDPANKDLFYLGSDMYAWCTSTALRAGVLSPNVQKKLGYLLLRLCHINTEYGRDDGVPSVRTSLFQLVQLGAVSVQHYLAERISTIFGLFVLSAHEPMFDDLQESLSSDITWTEGFAMRLLFLAELASSWPSLLRRSVYYIFEAPGMVPAAMPYATLCIRQVANSLHYKTPQKLFCLFAPQLLFSWLEQYKLGNLPFAVFGYETLREFMEHNRKELAAQLHLRAANEGIDLLLKTLQTSEADILQQAFGKSLAYAIASDIDQRLTPEQGPNCESRLRNAVGGKQEFNKLVAAQFPYVMGQFYLCIDQEDTQDKWVEKRPVEIQTALAEMKRYSHSIHVMPSSQEPCFKATRLSAQIERLCRRTGYDPTALWDPPSFTTAARILLDSVDDALGSLHVCAMLRKLRALIADAGIVPTAGYPLEMLLRSVRPFLSDSECADDVIGILQYLLQHGKSYLSGNLGFLCGVTCALVLQMRKHMGSEHDSTTQESQHRGTIQKMKAFCDWLTQTLRGLQVDVDPRWKPDYDTFVEVISHVQLPGNAGKNSAESELILLLARQQDADEPLFLARDVEQALSMLSKNFRLPATAADDTLSDDERCVKYVPCLWRAIRRTSFDESFVFWVTNAAGRAYAATGLKDLFVLKKEDGRHFKISSRFQGIERSQALVASRLCNILTSSNRTEAGLAEHTLQLAASSITTEDNSKASLAFEESIPEMVIQSLGRGMFGYVPPAASMLRLPGCDIEALHRAAALNENKDLHTWINEVALVLCQWPTVSPAIRALPAILQNLSQLALEWLPCIVHMSLASEIDHKQRVREALSSAMNEHLMADSKIHVPKQRYLLELLLYLRHQPYPRENTKVDRLHWLDVDHMLAADVASRCEMPTLSLMFAETAPPAEQTNKRASSRTSLPPLSAVSIPDRLLLSIFEQVDEPDSFYGVTQPASLAAVLSRLDYENDGFKSLMFRSAQVDDSMRRRNQFDDSDRLSMVKSLSVLNLNSLTFALSSNGLDGAAASKNALLESARKLQQWDIALPQSDDSSASRLIKTFQELTSTHQRLHALGSLRELTLAHLHTNDDNRSLQTKDAQWLNALGTLAEIQELVNNTGQGDVEAVIHKMRLREGWTTTARFEDFETMQQSRQTAFSVIARNEDLLRNLQIQPKLLRAAEARHLLSFSEMGRKHGQLQQALSAATQATGLTEDLSQMGLNIDAAAKHEIASVLWASGEHTVSVNVLRDILKTPDLDKQTIPVGRSGLLAQLGQQLADARLEKPGDILDAYLKPAIAQLGGNKLGSEAGKVFHAFASFCDQQLQHPANIEDFDRITTLRQRKLEEVEGLAELIKGMRKGSERDQHIKSHSKATQWFKLDNHEYQKQMQSREQFMQQSLKNYMLALHASDEHDICVLRLFALWLENSESTSANGIASRYLPRIPSWKFVVLLNQLMSRLKGDKSEFQAALEALTLRMATDHPYHCVHHVYASTLEPNSRDEAAKLRFAAASKIQKTVASNDKKQGELFRRLLKADEYYRLLAEESLSERKSNKMSIGNIRTAAKVSKRIPELHLPPVTMSVPLRPDCHYSGLPVVTSFGTQVRIMSGLSTPKVLTAMASDGKQYDQLFKSGNDDLRQDAIMEQVFDEVSKMLQNHKATRQRNLHIRTYKVIPTSNTSGIIEFVPNSVPIGDWLQPAHAKYHPKDVKVETARAAIRKVDQQSQESRVKEYRRVCDHLQPVLRHFFLERFDDPDEWFEKRTAYTRTTASVSILGHVLGLGDRHCSNIMLDEKTGEVVHIDLGVAFEAGRILPIPELVPFRLTRDVVDGMGVTKTEGIFRRCCEFTMDALREDRDSIMTLLNVLRYDPLYNWTLSPLRARRMQDASDGGHDANDVEAVENSKKKEQEAGEADRALAIVEKKLSKTLSTAATVNELIQQATDEANLATLFAGWMAFL